jgi:hypothetical protein
MGNEKCLTAFSALYSKGGIPCRLNHGSVRHKVVWKTEPCNLDYNPIFVVFCQGLREQKHPYVSIVKLGLTDLFEAEGLYLLIKGSEMKIFAVLDKIIQPLRMALNVKEKELFLTSIQMFQKLVILLGERLDKYLESLLPPIASKVMNSDSTIREAVFHNLTLGS